MSNSAAMSIEEKLIQRLKETMVGAAFVDEDALTELARRAIHEALFKDRIDRNSSSWNERKLPSPAMEAATRIATDVAQKIVAEQVEIQTANPEFRALVVKAFALALPTAINNAAMGLLTSSQQSQSEETLRRLQDMITRGLIVVPK